MTPTELTADLIDAYNRRDEARMRELLADDLVYVRPGPTRYRTADEIMDLYRREWDAFDAHVTIRRTLEQGDVMAGEITLTSPEEKGGAAVEAGVFHRWVDGKLVEYRAYVDPRSAR